MGTPYQRDCKYCNQRIRMAQMENGQWLPFELDGSGKHECVRSPASTAPLVQQQPEPNRTQYSVPKPHSGNGVQRSVCAVGVVLLIVLLWYFFK
jgi:type II secretory pathway pseudopilin PulG